MEYRPLQVAARLMVVLACLGGSAWAGQGGADDDQRADWERRLGHGKSLQKQGAALRKEALERFETEKTACFKKFRVNACQDEAKQRYAVALKESRQVENEGKALERQVKKEQLSDKDARRLDEAPEREASLRQREEATRGTRDAAAARRGERLAGQEDKAQEGEQRRLANEERIRQKRDKHDRKVAEKMEKARQRQAETAD